MMARNVNAFVVVLVRRLEVVELAINPADTIRKTRMPEHIAIATRLVERFVQRRERRRHLALVPLRETKKEQRRQHQKPVTQFRSKSQGFVDHFDRKGILGLKEVQTRTPRQPATQSRLVIQL